MLTIVRRFSSDIRRGKLRPTLADQGLVPGASLSGFTVRSVHAVKEFDVTLVELDHKRTGAKFLHVDAEDTNNAFAVCFRTPAKESTGVAHILEHIVLCGSQRYPVRDPFFKMLKRSMNTFMNAMTATDYTLYPFSTCVASDFSNLLGVYLDAAFFPLLKRNDFLQEGHRLEVVDNGTRLQRSGVVFNEMKGHLSSSTALFSMERARQLFGADSPYGQESGGDWKEIPDLTHERLVEFHSACYHPSNALFVTYGDLPLAASLETVDKNVLSRFEFSQSSAENPLQLIRSPLSANRQADVSISVPQDNDADVGRKLSRSWTLTDFTSTDVDDVFAASMVSALLMDGPSSPLYSALIESRLAPQYAPGSGLDTSSFFPSFSLGGSGIDESNVAKVEGAILSALEGAVKTGFASQRVDAMLHQMELGRRHRRADFGLVCVQHACSAFAHGGELRSALELTRPIVHFKSMLRENPAFLQELTEKWVLERFVGSTVRVVATPSATFSVKEPEERIQSSKQVEEVAQMNTELTAEREAVEDISVLPTLTVARDVPRESTQLLPQVQDVSFGQLVKNERTNGVAYLRGRVDLASHDSRLPLLCSLLGSVQAGKRSFKDLAVDLETVGGTLSVAPAFPVHLTDQTTHPEVFFSLDCLSPNSASAWGDVLGDVLTASRFDDEDRISTLLNTRSEAVKAGLSHACPRYANLKCMAHFGNDFAVQERYSGFSQYEFTQSLASGGQGRESLGRSLQELYDATFLHSRPTLSVCADGDVSLPVEAFLSRFPTGGKVQQHTPKSIHPTVSPRATYLSLPVPVHYCHAVVRSPVAFGHEDDAAMLVLSRLASYDFLHTNIREKGGAYGAGCSFDSSGFLSFSSFWDPNSTQTLKVFDECVKWMCEAEFTEKQVDEALLSLFASLDAPQHVSGKGLGQFRHGLTQEMKDGQRERLLALVGASGVSQLKTVARKHLQNVGSFVDPESKPGALPSSVCVAGKKDTGEEFRAKGFSVIVA